MNHKTSSRCGSRRERGDVTVTVILFPVVLALVMIAVQAALVFHARAVVTAAATDAARATQYEGGTTADGQAAAQQILDGSQGLLDDVEINIHRSGTLVQVDVTARVVSVVPFWTPTVDAHTEGVAEVFVPEPQR